MKLSMENLAMCLGFCMSSFALVFACPHLNKSVYADGKEYITALDKYVWEK